ncbi:hypothetical protein Efla_002048 [Eimeria flavescens]
MGDPGDPLLACGSLEATDAEAHPKLQRCHAVALGEPPNPRYASNSLHEEVVLEQLKLFESQARNAFPCTVS